jgi:hypothetical protein
MNVRLVGWTGCRSLNITKWRDAVPASALSHSSFMRPSMAFEVLPNTCFDSSKLFARKAKYPDMKALAALTFQNASTGK